MEMSRLRQESMRWHVLVTLSRARPYPVSLFFLLEVMRGIYPDVTAPELRRALDYLTDSHTISVKPEPYGSETVSLTRLGEDLVDYTVDSLPGIAHPAKYWLD